MTAARAPAERQILFSLWLLIFAVSSQVMVVAPILTRIGQELAVATVRLGALMTVYPAAVGVFALVAGPVSDRVGRRRVLIWGSVLMTAARLNREAPRSCSWCPMAASRPPCSPTWACAVHGPDPYGV